MRTEEKQVRLVSDIELLDAVAETLARSTGEVQLPIHILLENRFGDLNENQEEMLQAASTAADRIDVVSRQLLRILDLEHHRITFQPEALRIGDLMRSVLAIAAARGEHREVRVKFAMPPLPPSVVADRYFLGEALTALFTAVVDRADATTEVSAVVEDGERSVRITLDYRGPAPTGLDAVMARRLVAAQNGRVDLLDGRVSVELVAAGGGFRGSRDSQG
jgi:signal transduction histidine kinase